MIKLSNLLKETYIFIDELEKKFDEASEAADKEIAAIRKRKKEIAAAKKEYAKVAKIFDDWAWGRGNMSEKEFAKLVNEFQAKLKELGVLHQYDQIQG